jgi:hypothetical protein
VDKIDLGVTYRPRLLVYVLPLCFLKVPICCAPCRSFRSWPSTSALAPAFLRFVVIADAKRDMAVNWRSGTRGGKCAGVRPTLRMSVGEDRV